MKNSKIEMKEKPRISVHLSVQPQNWAVLQYISQYICYISTRSTYQYKSVRVATLSKNSNCDSSEVAQ